MAKNRFRNAKLLCCEDICNIENYYEALNDDENVWDVHHRREDDGTSVKELKERGLYFKRPASELIFMKHSEHAKHTQSTAKIDRNGEKNSFYGKSHSEETKSKIAAKNKINSLNNWQNKEYRKHQSEVHKGKHWFNNGICEAFEEECPEGFVKGRLLSTKAKISKTLCSK